MPALSARPRVIPSAAQMQSISHASSLQSLRGRRHAVSCLSNVIHCKPCSIEAACKHTNAENAYQAQEPLSDASAVAVCLTPWLDLEMRVQLPPAHAGSRVWHKMQEQCTYCCGGYCCVCPGFKQGGAAAACTEI